MTTNFRWHGKEVSEKVRAAAVRGLDDAAEHILEEANRTVPLDEGTLMRSGDIDVDEKKLEASVYYDTPYAVRQHEHPEYRHATGRRGKWLEQTLKERKGDVQKYLADQLRKAMKG